MDQNDANYSRERSLEKQLLPFGTVKRKADLLEGLKLSPVKLRYGLKKFGEEIPQALVDVEYFSSRFADFLLEDDNEYYLNFPDILFRSRIEGYIAHLVFEGKLKRRDFINPEAFVAMDMRKILKDHTTAVAQIAGRTAKTLISGEPLPTQEKFREMILEAAEQVVEESFGEPLMKLGLLPTSPGHETR